MKNLNKPLLISLLLLGSIISSASAQSINYGNSLSVLIPTGDFGDLYKGGYGINANFETKLSKIAIVGEFGYASFTGDDLDGSELKNITAWDLLAGLKVSLLGPLYIEGRMGYYFGDFDEFVLIPAVGARFKKFDLNVGYQAAGDVNFMNFRVGYLWGGSD
ncbi:MAG: hypothetical protein ABJO02_17515 [Reichenbachiella sp.]|uniref:hypothetical protein n=1 Tax=Reichenbachiella sp. TaxID=2184521 RepID=UPI003297D8A6